MKINLTKLREQANTHTSRFPVIALIDEIERLRGALEFYGSKENWWSAFDGDRNALARNFLTQADYSDGIDSAGGRARDALAAHRGRFEE